MTKRELENSVKALQEAMREIQESQKEKEMIAIEPRAVYYFKKIS